MILPKFMLKKTDESFELYGHSGGISSSVSVFPFLHIYKQRVITNLYESVLTDEVISRLCEMYSDHEYGWHGPYPTMDTINGVKRLIKLDSL